MQVCVKSLLNTLGLDCSPERLAKIKSRIAGINHMAWLLEITEDGRDLYPELRKLGERKLREWLRASA